MWKRSSKSNLRTLPNVKMMKKKNGANNRINTTNINLIFSCIKLFEVIWSYHWSYKKYSNIGKYCPVCAHLWVKISLEMQFSAISWRKNKSFPCGALLLYIVYEVFVKVLLFQETYPAPKNPCLCACNFQLFILTFILISGFLQIYPFTGN